MRKRHVVSAAAVALAFLVGCASPALADGIGKIVAVVNQIFGGSVDGSGATTGQALVKQADGSWKAGTVGASFPLLAPNGTSGAPSYSFSGATGTGVYLNGTTLSFSVAGADRLTLKNNGWLTIKPDTAGGGTVATQTLDSAGNSWAITSFAANNWSSGDLRAQVGIYDGAATGAGVGGGIAFLGYTHAAQDGNYAVLANIRGAKENATDSNALGCLIFTTNSNASGGTFTEAWRVTSSGHFFGNSGSVVGWTSGAGGSTADTGLSRDAAGVLDVGTGAQGSKAGFVAASGVSVGNGTAVTSAGGIRWVSGLGSSITHILGPTDQDFNITSGAGRAFFINTGTVPSGTGGAFWLTSGASLDGNGGTVNISAAGSLGSGTLGGSIVLNLGTGNVNTNNGTLDIGCGSPIFRFSPGAGTQGIMSIYAGVNTAGWGIPAIYASGRVTAQTAAKATLATYTPNTDGSFEVIANVRVTTSTTHAFTVTCSYTDESSAARTVTLPFVLVAGSAITTSVANANGAVPYMGIPVRIRALGGLPITIQTTGTFTTVTYNVEADIRQVR